MKTKLIGGVAVEVLPDEDYLYSDTVRMVGSLRINLTTEEDAERIEANDLADAEHAADGWIRGRKKDYLSMEEQIDMIYWDMKNGTSTFTDHRDAVKAAHPKQV